MPGSTKPSALTAEELAVLTHTSVRTIHRQIANGEVPHFKVGRSLRIPGDYVESLTSPKQTAPEPNLELCERVAALIAKPLADAVMARLAKAALPQKKATTPTR